MKKSFRNILFSVAALSMAVAVGAGLGLADKKEVKPIEAVEVQGQLMFYDVDNISWWHNDSASTGAHMYGGSESTGWPGASMTRINGTNLYYVHVDTSLSNTNVIFTRQVSGNVVNRSSKDGASKPLSLANISSKNTWKPLIDTSNWDEVEGNSSAGSWTSTNWNWTVVGSTSGTWTSETQDINISLNNYKFDGEEQFYSTSVTLTSGSVFKIKDNFNNYYGYTKLTTNEFTASYFIGDVESDSNITVSKSGTFELYMKPTSGEFWIQVSSATEADAYASNFLSSITCTDTSVTSDLSAWNKVGTATTSMEYKFEQLTSGAKNILKSATANKGGTTVEQCVARYDRILSKYGYGTAEGQYHDFMSRTPALQNTSIKLLFGNGTSTEATVIIVTVTALAAIAVGGYFLLKKKRA